MKKSAFIYSFAFAVGQLFAPAVSYSQTTSYNSDTSGSGLQGSSVSGSGAAERRDFERSSGLIKDQGGSQSKGQAGAQVDESVGNPSSTNFVGPRQTEVTPDGKTWYTDGDKELARGADPALVQNQSATRQEASTDGSGTTGDAANGAASMAKNADNDMKDQQLDSQVRITAAMAQVTAAVTNGSGVGGVFPTYKAILAAEKKYSADKPNCVSRHSSAASACLEHLSPQILTGVTTLNTLLATLGGASVNDSCSSFAKAMDLAKVAMTGYTAACGTMKAGCGLSCVSARSGLETIQKTIGTSGYTCTIPGESMAMCKAAGAQYLAALKTLSAAVAEELNQNEKKSIAGKASLCTEKYAQLITSGLSGILSLVNSAKQGNKCDQQTAAAETDVCKVAATANTEACLCKVATSQACICLKNPRTPGCSSGIAEANQGSGNQYTGLGATDRSNIANNGGSDLSGLNTNSSGIEQRTPSSDGMSGAPPPTGGGGGAGLGGGGGGSGAGGDAGSAGRKGLNANILGGSGGGGGGGGWSAGGGGSSAANSKYRSYLPGGANDPNKGMAGQAWTKEVTGQGGKSNWEKVKDRYRDNKNTLLNN